MGNTVILTVVDRLLKMSQLLCLRCCPPKRQQRKSCFILLALWSSSSLGLPVHLSVLLGLLQTAQYINQCLLWLLKLMAICRCTSKRCRYPSQSPSSWAQQFLWVFPQLPPCIFPSHVPILSIGSKPPLLLDLEDVVSLPLTHGLGSRYHLTWGNAWAAHLNTSIEYQGSAKYHSPETCYRVGQKVWFPHLVKEVCCKLALWFLGPFLISRIIKPIHP